MQGGNLQEQFTGLLNGSGPYLNGFEQCYNLLWRSWWRMGQ
jgi:hypothetical protein